MIHLGASDISDRIFKTLPKPSKRTESTLLGHDNSLVLYILHLYNEKMFNFTFDIYIMNLNIFKDLVYSGIDMYQFYNHIKHNEIIHGKKSFLTLKVNCSEQNNVNKR